VSGRGEARRATRPQSLDIDRALFAGQVAKSRWLRIQCVNHVFALTLTDEPLDIIREVTGEELPLLYNFVEHDLVDGGYTTYQEVKPYSYGGIAFHPRNEGKCLNYIKENLAHFRSQLNDNSLFWIIGSQPQ
jgi:hypothetical protein